MKKRILFVDDEPLVLQGIQRMLRGMREQWDMDFADGGAKAKEQLAVADYDVVVTDMMMPGVNGADVLDHARLHSPRTVRLVLSGHAEQSVAVQCVGVAHQYLTKPCDAETLKQTVTRLTDPAFALQNEHVMKLVAQLKHLPSIPEIYTKIVELLHDPNSSIEDVGALIASDMAMTAKILQIVNSSFFGLARRVSRPVEAAGYLGIDTLKSLVLATNVFGQYETKAPNGYSAVEAAKHSQEVGAAARAIAKAEDMHRGVVDDAFVAGLLHDVGDLVLASSMPEQFERASAQPDADGRTAEMEIFGTTHAEVGGYLLGLWGLPARVIEGISLHHQPRESQVPEFSPLTAVHVAECLVGERASTKSSKPAPAVDLEYLAKIGLSDRLPAWRSAVEETLNCPPGQN